MYYSVYVYYSPEIIFIDEGDVVIFATSKVKVEFTLRF